MSRVEIRRAQQKAQRVHWRTLIDEAQTSDRGPTEFCRARGLYVAHFYYWRRALALEGQEQKIEGRFAQKGLAKGLSTGLVRSLARHNAVNAGDKYAVLFADECDPVSIGRQRQFAAVLRVGGPQQNRLAPFRSHHESSA